MVGRRGEADDRDTPRESQGSAERTVADLFATGHRGRSQVPEETLERERGTGRQPQRHHAGALCRVIGTDWVMGTARGLPAQFCRGDIADLADRLVELPDAGES